MRIVTVAILIVSALMCLLPQDVQSQGVNPSGRSYVQLPQALGMGDAIVALPQQQSSFFYNPAHAAKSKFHVTLAGARLSVSTNVLEQVDFFQSDLKPALDEGLENLTAEELETLYDRTLEVGRQSTLIGLDVLGPSVGLRLGPLGLAIGAFAQSNIRYRFPDGGGGLPLLQAAGVADAMGVGSVGMKITKGLTVGITGKYNRRYVTFKTAPLDVVANEEPFYAYVADRMSVDLGVMYRVPLISKLPGTFNVGLALYDIAGNDMDFAYDQTLMGDESASPSDEEIEAVNEIFGVRPSYRIGVAYAFPKTPGGLLDESGFTFDYLGFNQPQIDQVFLTHLRMGIQAKVKILALRAGLNQGYPSIGGGLSLGVIDLDYAYYGLEEGRYPGQLPLWNHTAHLRIGL